MNALDTDLRPEYPAVPGQDIERQLRTALGQYATGVAVVTALQPDGRPVGMTINSFSALSLDPPLILWCLRRTASSGAAFLTARHFAVNVLAAGQAHLARQFAVRWQSAFDEAPWRAGPHGLPLLLGTAGAFACRHARQADGGDHVIIVAYIEEFSVTAGRQPLIFHGGHYHELSHSTEEPV
jgi:flavin reductase (DIM6/NTAB) family NADH-FMN oxidoreductase RutF